jgi:hypothetical protein
MMKRVRTSMGGLGDKGELRGEPEDAIFLNAVDRKGDDGVSSERLDIGADAPISGGVILG